ncbi:aspartate/glutamate racemase family protein [Pukyongiella litopenaei]|uniref:Aspartate/glutamate racemase family protein n=1 Tax=Pukyongiella litopenaei TaxID=2605946 RepID=A0A2S0MNI9_9RHOB|nr:aspartate/glutamate racemase family protein [Pukyongiella litopenaei]AVO37440.1 aspartate/glutamate racemase family protein [Pukyongiella litopenaei]
MARLGILSLDTAFPRIAGDVGCAESYPFPCDIEIVAGADSPDIVRDRAPAPALLDRFAHAARALEGRGATAIVSTCGFLVSAQARIAAEVTVPVMLSSLSLCPVIRATCPGRIGILTASRGALGPGALAAAGIAPQEVAIAGLEHDAIFAGTFLAARTAQATGIDRAAMERTVVAAARDLVAGNPDLGAILLECGNLPPYAEAIRAATGLPVFHLVDAAHWLVRAAADRRPALSPGAGHA